MNRMTGSVEESTVRYQFSVRALLVLTGVTATFFSVATALGYADATAICVGLALVVCLMRYPRRVHPATGTVLVLVAATVLWLNLRPTGWQEEFCVEAPDGLAPLTRAMFWRGWPLCPCMLCVMHGMAFDPDMGFPGLAIALDGVVFVIALFAAKAVCERCVRRVFRINAQSAHPSRAP